MLGQAGTVKVEKDRTVIVNGAGEKADIDARINAIKTLSPNPILTKKNARKDWLS